MGAIFVSEPSDKVYIRDGRMDEKLTKLVHKQLEERLPLGKCTLVFKQRTWGDVLKIDNEGNHYDMSMWLNIMRDNARVHTLPTRMDARIKGNDVHVDWISFSLSKRDVKLIRRNCSDKKKK